MGFRMLRTAGPKRMPRRRASGGSERWRALRMKEEKRA